VLFRSEFYKNLYSKQKLINETEKTEAAKYFNDNTLPKVSEMDKTKCEIELTIEEIGITLKGLQNGKSPGTDGFMPDFYKFFWPDIKNTVFESLSFAFEVDKLSIDQRRGIINLIPKKDKDPRQLKNWHQSPS
jgi:hypothetical protein